LQDYNALVASKKDLEGRLEKEHKDVLDAHRKHDNWVKADAIHDTEAQQLYETTKSQLLSSQAEEKRLSGVVSALENEINKLKSQIGSLQHEKAHIEDKANNLSTTKKTSSKSWITPRTRTEASQPATPTETSRSKPSTRRRRDWCRTSTSEKARSPPKKAEITKAHADLADAEQKPEAIREDGGWIKPTSVAKQ
jgi:chromosome segregation ATPase